MDLFDIIEAHHKFKFKFAKMILQKERIKFAYLFLEERVLFQ